MDRALSAKKCIGILAKILIFWRRNLCVELPRCKNEKKIGTFLHAGSITDTQISLITKNFPNDSTTTTSFTITTASDKVDTRVRARSIALKIENTSSAENWKLGTFRLDIQPDGRRG